MSVVIPFHRPEPAEGLCEGKPSETEIIAAIIEEHGQHIQKAGAMLTHSADRIKTLVEELRAVHGIPRPGT